MKGMILAAVSSSKWQQPVLNTLFENENDDDDESDEYFLERKRNYINMEEQATSLGNVSKSMVICRSPLHGYVIY